MLPLLALGAVLAGGIIAFEAASPSKSSGARESSRESHDAAKAAASPQSYIVTPVGGDGQAMAQAPQQPNGISASDSVNKFIFS